MEAYKSPELQFLASGHQTCIQCTDIHASKTPIHIKFKKKIKQEKISENGFKMWKPIAGTESGNINIWFREWSLHSVGPVETEPFPLLSSG